ITTTRGSASAAAIACLTSAAIRFVHALSCAGRFSVIVATGSSTSYRICSYTGVLPGRIGSGYASAPAPREPGQRGGGRGAARGRRLGQLLERSDVAVDAGQAVAVGAARKARAALVGLEHRALPVAARRGAGVDRGAARLQRVRAGRAAVARERRQAGRHVLPVVVAREVAARVVREVVIERRDRAVAVAAAGVLRDQGVAEPQLRVVRDQHVAPGV